MDTKAIDIPTCIICRNDKVHPHFYPSNRYNGKEFRYYECEECGSLSIFPLPSQEDLDKMYGKNDHAYLFELKEDEPFEHQLDYPANTYQRYQLDFLASDILSLPGKKLLDFACGNGYYVAHAQKLGFEAYGVEYNEALSALLRKKTGLNIFTYADFNQRFGHIKFDVIHLGHVLEHLTDPAAMMHDLKQHAHGNTVFIIDGPLENNASLARAVINIGSRLRRKAYNEFEPQHLSFTTYGSQLKFFEKLGMTTLGYECREQYWPLPASPGPGLSSASKHFLAKCSILLSGLFPAHGNVFHYRGKFKKHDEKTF